MSSNYTINFLTLRARIQTEENTNKKAYLLGLSLVDKFDKSTLVLEGATLQIRTLYHSCALDTLVSSLLLSSRALVLGPCTKNTPHFIRILTNSPLAYSEALIITTSPHNNNKPTPTASDDAHFAVGV